MCNTSVFVLCVLSVWGWFSCFWDEISYNHIWTDVGVFTFFWPCVCWSRFYPNSRYRCMLMELVWTACQFWVVSSIFGLSLSHSLSGSSLSFLFVYSHCLSIFRQLHVLCPSVCLHGDHRNTHTHTQTHKHILSHTCHILLTLNLGSHFPIKTV